MDQTATATAPVSVPGFLQNRTENFAGIVREPGEPGEPRVSHPGHPVPHPPRPSPPPKPTLPVVQDGPWAPPNFVGGDGGKDFQIMPHNNSIVQKFGLWRAPASDNGGKQWLTGVRIVQFNGDTAEFGGKKGDYREITFSTGEHITSLQIYGNGVGTRTGRVVFQTDKGQSFDWGQDTSNQTAYVPNLGSGLLVGVAGRAGDDLDLLAMYFLGPIDSVKISNTKYATDVTNTNMGISPAWSFEATYGWTGAPYNYIFSGNRIKKNTSSWSSSTTRTFGVEVNATVSVPMLVSIGGKETWTSSVVSVQGNSTEDIAQLNWSAAGAVAGPTDNFLCTATAFQGSLYIPYTSTVTVQLKDGRQWVYTDSGTFQNVQWSKVATSVQRIPAGATPEVGEKELRGGKMVKI